MTDKLIQTIVDRDTPPNDDDEVIDWDIRGTPITRGDVRRWENLRQKWEMEDNE